VIELLDEAPTRVTTCRTTIAETDVQGFLPGALTRRGYLLLFLASGNQELTKTEDLFILTGLVQDGEILQPRRRLWNSHGLTYTTLLSIFIP
jgi:hypothetical protein